MNAKIALGLVAAFVVGSVIKNARDEQKAEEAKEHERQSHIFAQAFVTEQFEKTTGYSIKDWERDYNIGRMEYYLQKVPGQNSPGGKFARTSRVQS